jgi:hypothetical protein
MNPYLNIDTIIEYAFLHLGNHPLVRQPKILNKVGTPIKITRFRDDNGFDENQDGLTLSIYPYTYDGTSNETVQTGNAALVYEHYHIGSGTSQPSFDRCRVHLVAKLQALSYNRPLETVDYDGFTIQFVRNETERALRKWMEQLRTILLTNPTNNLSGLVKNSHVNHIVFRTSEWTGKEGKNAVLHEASLLWQIEINSPRNWKTWPLYNPLDGVDNWEYIGLETQTGRPIYYDNGSSWMVSVDGYIISTTPPPANLPVKWDNIQKRFETPAGVPLTNLQLVNPANSKPWIDTNLLIIGVKKAPLTGTYNALEQNLFWNISQARIELADGTIVTTLDDSDGNPTIGLSYDPLEKVLSVTYPSQSTRPVNPNIDPVYTFNSGKVSIYDANGITLRESFNT